MAAILASLHMQTADDLFGGPQGSPRSDKLIAASVQWAEKIMRRLITCFAHQVCHNRTMCGRYRLSRSKQIVEAHFSSAPGEEDCNPRYNIAATQLVHVIRQNTKEPRLGDRGYYRDYFGIHVNVMTFTPSALHFAQSNFSQPRANPSMRLSDRRSISTSRSSLHQFVTFPHWYSRRE